MNRKILRLPPNFWLELLEFLARLSQEERIHELIIDSFPVFACSPRRSYRCQLYTGKEWIGYSSSKRTYYYGIKVHMIVSEKGAPITFCFLPASFSDLGGLDSLIGEISSDTLIFADKAYESRKRTQMLGGRQIYLMALKRGRSRGQYSTKTQEWIKSKRQWVETSFSQIVKNMGRNILARMRRGFEMRLILFIMAYAMSVADFTRL